MMPLVNGPSGREELHSKVSQPPDGNHRHYSREHGRPGRAWKALRSPSNAKPDPTQRVISCKPAFELMIPLPRIIAFGEAHCRSRYRFNGGFDLNACWPWTTFQAIIVEEIEGMDRRCRADLMPMDFSHSRKPHR